MESKGLGQPTPVNLSPYVRCDVRASTPSGEVNYTLFFGWHTGRKTLVSAILGVPTSIVADVTAPSRWGWTESWQTLSKGKEINHRETWQMSKEGLQKLTYASEVSIDGGPWTQTMTGTLVRR
jgi:hypothetical protein